MEWVRSESFIGIPSISFQHPIAHFLKNNWMLPSLTSICLVAIEFCTRPKSLHNDHTKLLHNWQTSFSHTWADNIPVRSGRPAYLSEVLSGVWSDGIRCGIHGVLLLYRVHCPYTVVFYKKYITQTWLLIILNFKLEIFDPTDPTYDYGLKMFLLKCWIISRIQILESYSSAIFPKIYPKNEAGYSWRMILNKKTVNCSLLFHYMYWNNILVSSTVYFQSSFAFAFAFISLIFPTDHSAMCAYL